MNWSSRAVVRQGVAALLVSGLVGCGGDAGYHVSGTVTFDGKPIPAGKIYFTPDNSKGNSGATGYATIENGAYNTSAEGGKPIVGGPTIVGIEGADPSVETDQNSADTSGEVTIKSLFPYYTTTAELPEEDVVQDFDVPAEAAAKRIRPEGPAMGGP